MVDVTSVAPEILWTNEAWQNYRILESAMRAAGFTALRSEWRQ